MEPPVGFEPTTV